MRILSVCLALAALSLLGGCLAKAVVDVATAPVKVVSKGVDMATTSQSEADEKRGRELRKREERRGKLDRDYRKLNEQCHDGSDKACAQRDTIGREIDQLSPDTAYRQRN